MPVQTIPNNKKNKEFKKDTMDSLYSEAKRQREENFVFADIRKMSQGNFTYKAVDIEHTYSSNPWVEAQINKLGGKVAIPTHIKHFDFIGIIVNAIAGIYSQMPDLYRVDSLDEYFTNEYIRERTEGLHKYAQAIFDAEINRMLFDAGLDPKKQNFKSQEEAEAYQAQLDAKVKSYTPEEIERNMSKNFKVSATEWATNKLTSDKKIFHLEREDKKALIDYILTGRWFRHYKVGYDHYDLEYWSPEEVFFSQDVDIEYPQDADFVGRLTSMSQNSILTKYGHLMTTPQQEAIGSYWIPPDSNTKGSKGVSGVFSSAVQVPFKNYYEHQINLQMEDALGVPLARTMDENGNVSGRHYTPRQEVDYNSRNGIAYASYMRSDINVRRDLIEVMEVYFRSMKRVGVLIHKDENGNPIVDITTDDLLKEYLVEEDIKKLKNISLEEIQDLIKNGGIEEHIGKIYYFYAPEIWSGIMIKAGGYGLKEDILLNVEPLKYQIKGDSNFYKVRIPVGGLISNSIIPKILPHQQIYNVCMNQNSELLAKEANLGIFFSLDINTLPSEYKDETTEEALYAITDTIRDTGILPLDPGRANTQNNSVYPNMFQRNEITFANQIEYRHALAMQHKQLAFDQVGVTPQMLGQPNTYTTAEGVKQGAQATYTLMDGMVQEFNTSQAIAKELHLAIAQFCETNGKSTSKMSRLSDNTLRFLDILAEDDLFPLRNLSVIPATDSRDRKIVEALQGILLNDNTIDKDFADLIELMQNPYMTELKDLAVGMRKRANEKQQQEQSYQAEQLDKQINAQKEESEKAFERAKEIEHIRGEYKLEEEQINAYGRAALSADPERAYDRIQKDTQFAIQNDFTQQGLNLKALELDSKQKLSDEQRKNETDKLKALAEDRKLKREIMQSQERVSIRNKN
jgi:hypothetical protein